jgi:hypothetical protein
MTMAFESKHSQKLSAFAAKFGLPDHGDDHAREWTKQLAEQFAFSFPGEGWGTKRASHSRPPSTDVICRPENGILIGYDTVIDAGISSAQLNPHPHGEDLTGQVFISVSPIDHLQDGSAQPHQCRLGVSWFPAIGLAKKDPARYTEQLEWFRDVLKPDYARCFWYLDEGPWNTIGSGPHLMSDSERIALLQIVTEDLLDIGIAPQWTVFGTVVRDAGRCRQLIQQFAEAIRPFGSRCFLVDGVNEPGAIGYTPGHYAETRQIARELAASHLGVKYISAASPDFLHGGINGQGATDAEVEADTCKLYDGLPVEINAITPHWGRAPWTPHRPLGRCAHGKAILNDEPRGFRSSVAQIDRPEDFARDYKTSADAGEIGYTFHTEPGVWQGYCDASARPDWDDNNKYPLIQSIPRIAEIVEALHEIRAGGSIPIDPIDPPGGGDEMIPYDEAKSVEFGQECNKVYEESGAAKDPGMVSVHSSRAAWDYYVGGMSWEDSKKKHVNEFRAEYGLPPI